MKSEEEIKQEIENLEQQALKRIRGGYTNLKYSLIYRLQALRWVLEEGEKCQAKNLI